MRLPKVHHFFFCLVLAECTVSLALGQQGSQNPTVSSEPQTMIVNVTVTDQHRNPVIGLKTEDFALSEAGLSQEIGSVRTGVPACMGLVVDISGSMRRKLPPVTTALLDFVRASDAKDRIFVVNFNNEPYLDQDFTSDVDLIEEALRHAEARGGTALYDAVIASANHLAQGRDCQKRVLVVVSDGADNESRKTLQQTILALQESQGSLVYAIYLAEEYSPAAKPARQALQALADATGGALFFIGKDRDLGPVALRAAQEIHGQYTISYRRTHRVPDAASIALTIEVHAADHRKLLVRTNSPVWADQPLPDPAVVAKKTVVPAKQPIDQLAIPLSPPPPLTSCIAGSVVDEEGRPIQGMTVEVSPGFKTNAYPRNKFPSAVTGEKGEFKIRDLEAGRYRVDTTNESQDYPPTKYQFYQYSKILYAVASEACDNIAIQLGPRAARLKITAVDPDTGALVGHFLVYLRSASRGSFFSQSNSERDILVPANAELTISVSAPGYSRGQPVSATTPGPENSQEVIVPLGPPLSASKTRIPD